MPTSPWLTTFHSILAAMLMMPLVGCASSRPQAAPADYPFGWYDRVSDPQSIAPLVQTGRSNVLLPYHVAASDDAMQAYLDQVHAQQASVVVEVPRDAVKDRRSDELGAFIERFNHHPAVMGWYTADEPSLHGWPVEALEQAYRTIKAHSDKPVFMVFSWSETYRNQPQAYKNAYDVLMIDAYPYRVENKAFAGVQTADWEKLVRDTGRIARELDKPWWNVLQASGQIPERRHSASWRFRLPTYQEAQYQLYLSILHDAQGVVYWAYYRMDQTFASEDAPYAHAGPTWFKEIFTPMAREFEGIRHAIGADRLVTDLTHDRQDVLVRVYRDPKDGSHVLVALNTVGITRELSADLGVTWSQATRVDSSPKGELVHTTGRSAKLTIEPYQALIYRLR